MTPSEKWSESAADSLSPLARRRLRMGIEVTIVVTAAVVLYHVMPWHWPVIVKIVGAAGLALAGFLAYLAVRFQGYPATPSVVDFRRTRYQMPKRFSLRTIVFLTLVMAVASALLQSIHASAMISLVTLAFVALISFMQIVLERIPRVVSAACGIGWGVVMVVVAPLQWYDPILFIPLGGLLGYFAGTFIAGIFLAASAIDYWWNELDVESPAAK